MSKKVNARKHSASTARAARAYKTTREVRRLGKLQNGQFRE